MADQAPKPKTKADVAKLVKRQVVETVDGKPVAKLVAVKADEVLDFADHGTHIVVVTVDGQKLTSAPAGE